MVYNKLYNLLFKARDNADLASLATALGLSKQSLRKQLESLDEGLPSTLYARLDGERVELSEVGLAYASACEKANRLFIEAELKGEKFKRERENTIVVGCLSRNIDRRLKKEGLGYSLKTRFFDSAAATADFSTLGRDLDLALGIYDEAFLRRSRLKAVELDNSALSVALSVDSPLAKRKRLDIEDLYESTLYVPKKGLTKFTDLLIADLKDFHQKIRLEERTVCNASLAQKVADENAFILVAKSQDLCAFSLKTIPVDWGYRVSYGILYSQKPSAKVEALVAAMTGKAEI